jgi:hypothetical protein
MPAKSIANLPPTPEEAAAARVAKRKREEVLTGMAAEEAARNKAAPPAPMPPEPAREPPRARAPDVRYATNVFSRWGHVSQGDVTIQDAAGSRPTTFAQEADRGTCPLGVGRVSHRRRSAAT